MTMTVPSPSRVSPHPEPDGSADRAVLADLCEIARCPISGSRLRPATGAELDDANRSASESWLTHRDGTAVQSGITAGLVTETGDYLYLLKDGIALFLPEYAIALDPRRRHDSAELRSEKQNVKSFYDDFGWARDGKGDFEDAVIWEYLRPVSADYLHRCHLRVNDYLAPRGRYLLDAASGPVQYDEYLTYSQNYHRRVCVDLSFRALQEARRKLGDRALYVLGDITNLPFMDGAMDAVVSLHTLYHVPADEQRKGFEELYRVLKPGRTGVVVYHWQHSAVTRLLNALASPLQKLKHATRRPSAPAPTSEPSSREAPPAWETELYYHAHAYRWFTSQQWSFPLEFVVWRTLGVQCMRTWIRPKAMGRAVLALLYRLENLLPHLAGRLGEYPMLVLRKG
jgi:SAM-dependent methyltransferase